ncbi:MAG: FHA domain-containing protein [Lentisphaeria bacterium]|nr:FHA domain-containing protein [Lentisphaeria bacterium]
MRIVVLSDGMKNFRFETDLLTIGRADDNLLQLDVPGVSRYHGKVEKSGNDYLIYDFGSTNGIYVNGEKISEYTTLHEGDIVRLHEVKLQFFELQDNSSGSNGGIVFSEVVEELPQVVVSESNETSSNSPANKTTFFEPKNSDDEIEGNKDADVKDIAEYLKNNRIFQKNKDSRNKSDKKNPPLKEKNSETPGRKNSNWMFYVIVVCVVISLLSLFVIFVVKKDVKNLNGEAANRPSAAATVKVPDLYLDYVKEIISNDNIYRYALRIEKNKAFFSVDDVKSQLSIGPIPLQLDEVDLSRLRQGINDSGFFKIAENNYEKFENIGERDSRELIIYLGNENRRIKVVNSEIPIEFRDVEDTLDLYIQSCDLPFLTLSTEELKKRAIESFYRAEELFANYEANYGNLKEAIKEYNLVKEYLRGFSPEPIERKKAIVKLEQADKIRKDRFKTLRAEYDSFIHKKDFAGARNVVVMILDLYGEETKEYEFFRDRLIKIDEHLRSTNRRGKKNRK